MFSNRADGHQGQWFGAHGLFSCLAPHTVNPAGGTWRLPAFRLDALWEIRKSDFMKLRISATETVRRFSELMNRVRYRGESFVVERGDRDVARVRGAPRYIAPPARMGSPKAGKAQDDSLNGFFRG